MDYTQVLVTFIATLPATIAAISALIVTVKTKSDVRKIEIATNSMKDALVKATGDARFAEGEKVGQASHKAEMKQDAADAKEKP